MWLWIVENTLAAGMLALLCALVCRFNRRRPALCHLLWLLVFVTLVAPPLPLSFSPGSLLRQGVGEWLRAPFAAAGLHATAATTEEQVEETGALLGIESTAAGLDQQAAMTVKAPSTQGWFPSSSLASWMVGLWLAASCGILGWVWFRLMRFHSIVRRAPLASSSLGRRVREVAGHLGVPAPPVREVEGIGSPSIWCFGPPRLLWPATRGPAPALREEPAIIAHELAHLARRDHWVARLDVLVVGLCWWHPLVWIIRRQVHKYAELSCDAWALWAYPTGRRAFAEAVIEVQEKTVMAPVALQGLCATDRDCRDFERRLNMIMKLNVSHGVSKGAAAVAILTTAFVVPGISGEPAPTQPAAAVTDAELSPVSVEDRVKLRKLTGKAEELYASEDYEQAIDLYEQVLESDPDHALACARLGFMRIAVGEYDMAADHFEQQIALGYDRATACYNLACASALAGDQAAAISALQRSVRLGFANVKLMAKDIDLESIHDREEFTRAVEMARKGEDLRQQIGKGKMKGASPKQALAAHRALTEIASEDGEAFQTYGVLALKVGEHDEAMRVFQRQAELGHDPANAYYNLACARSLSGDVDGAIEALQRSARLGMSYPEVRKDADLASLRDDPRYSKIEERLLAPTRMKQKVDQLLATGDLEAAARVLEKVAADPHGSKKMRTWARYEMAMVQLKSDLPEDAILAFHKAMDAGYPAERAVFQIASCHAAMGDDDEALAQMKNALALGFDDPAQVRQVAERWHLADEQTTEMLILRAKEQAREKSGSKKKKMKKKQVEMEKKLAGGKTQ